MKRITVRDKIIGIADSWKRQYPTFKDEKKKYIWEKLCSLDKDITTAEEINKIIGNDSWTTPPECHECGKTVDAVVEIGEKSDYESKTACICINCLRSAINTLESLQR